MREQLKKFKNQDVVLTAKVKTVKYRRYVDRFSKYKKNVHILLKKCKNKWRSNRSCLVAGTQ